MIFDSNVAISWITTLFQGANLITFFIKAFGILLTGVYVLFSIISLKQTQIMLNTIEVSGKHKFMIVGFIQLIVSALLLFYAIVIL